MALHLSRPTNIVFYLSLILGLLALISHFVDLGPVTLHQFWVALIAWAVLTVGNVMKGV